MRARTARAHRGQRAQGVTAIRITLAHTHSTSVSTTKPPAKPQQRNAARRIPSSSSTPASTSHSILASITHNKPTITNSTIQANRSTSVLRPSLLGCARPALLRRRVYPPTPTVQARAVLQPHRRAGQASRRRRAQSHRHCHLRGALTASALSN
eukprot:5190743-Pleurochrysis_carterae.AAC.1